MQMIKILNADNQSLSLVKSIETNPFAILVIVTPPKAEQMKRSEQKVTLRFSFMRAE